MLGLDGALRARAVLLDSATSIEARGGFQTVLVGHPGWREYTPDVVSDPERDPERFVPEVLRGRQLDLARVIAHARRGGLPLRLEVEQALRAARPS